MVDNCQKSKHMQALVYEGPRQLNLRDVPAPTPAPPDVLIEVAYSGICGSELGGYLGHNTLREPPLIMGHEFSGTIAAMGEHAEQYQPDIAVGQRVTVNPLVYCNRCRLCLSGRHNLCSNRELLGAHQPGSYADYVKVHARMVHAIPDTLSLAHAALTEPLACAIRAARLAACTPLETVLIIGLGPIGLLTLQIIQAFGVTNIFTVETDAGRRAIGESFDVEVLDPEKDGVVQWVQAQTEGAGVDVAVDAVGATITRKQSVAAVAPGGRVVCIGLHDEESPIPINLAIRNEIKVYGSFAYTPSDFQDAIRWLAAERIYIDPWLVKASLVDGKVWFERLIDEPGPVVKTLLTTE